MSYIIAILIFIFLNFNRIKYRYLIIARVIVSILTFFLIPQFLYKHYSLNLITPASRGVTFAGVLIQTILCLIIIISLSNTVEIKSIDETELLV